jgi:hypothetical protein
MGLLHPLLNVNKQLTPKQNVMMRADRLGVTGNS